MVTTALFADVVLPLALPRAYTYQIPLALQDAMRMGVRVVVPLGRQKRYMGVVIRVHRRTPEFEGVKEIEDIVDPTPIITSQQLRFWGWMARYYLCTAGDMLKATLPRGMQLEQETELEAIPLEDLEELGIALLPQQERLLEDIRSAKPPLAGNILKGANGKGTTLDSLIHLGLVSVKERMGVKSKAKREQFVYLAPGCNSLETLGPVLDHMGRAVSQQKLLLGMVALLQEDQLPLEAGVPRARLLRHTGCTASALKGLEKKRLLRTELQEVSSLPPGEPPSQQSSTLSPAQETCYQSVVQQFQSKCVCLLRGVTGSGKTEIYIQLIADTLKQGKQALYMLPEIALTAQIVKRLQAVFGDRVGVFHSRQSDRARVELYEAILHGGDPRTGSVYDVVLGARSALFLPYRQLGLIIVDEEHENSYRQTAPAPRYNARDAAIQLGNMVGAKVLLGSATPSIESYTNAKLGKYGYAALTERFGNAQLPSVQILDIRVAQKQKAMREHFSHTLIQGIQETLQTGGQVILFQNRRGYSPYIECEDCGWVAQCPNCDVSLVYHKRDRQLHCHYCGHTEEVPGGCKDCGSVRFQWRGLGTQRVEEELCKLVPKALVGRLDLDTTRGKDGATRVIQQFSNGEVNVLIGTQMVTKGLDFRHVRLVGILDADALLRQADFRATERAFQLMAQVGGRAGRGETPGIVLIQTRQPEHPVFQWVSKHDYEAFYAATMLEREQTHYPPYTRLVEIEVSHAEEHKALHEATAIAGELQRVHGDQVSPPCPPPVAWVRNKYRFRILLRRQSVELGQEQLAGITLLRAVKVTVDP